MRRILLAAVMLGAAAGAHAADMPDLPILRGAFTEGPAAAPVYWQGYYIGGGRRDGSIPPKPPAWNRLPPGFVPPPRPPPPQPSRAQARGGAAFPAHTPSPDLPPLSPP